MPTDQDISETRVAQAAERLRAWLVSGQFRPGDQLPTQIELAESFGLSRSVIREAIATLKAEGSLTSRRGAGVFVASSVTIPFRLHNADLSQIPQVLNLLELRAAVEIEAAGHAAQRRTPTQMKDIREALDRIDANIGSETDTIAGDQDFHLAIARAAGNPRFTEFLDFLRGILIPRQTIRLKADASVGTEGYLRMLQREHREIEDAIRIGDPVGARAAMRRHLGDGARRYRQWAEDSAADTAVQAAK